MRHDVNRRLLQGRVKVLLVGAGGTGSQVLSGLARFHTALVALGHPGGLEVHCCDPDIVTSANVGRQLFSPADVGVNKATVLIHRLNAYYGLNWKAHPVLLNDIKLKNFDLVIGCVDTKQARRDIHHFSTEIGAAYWLDLGNLQHDGQVVLGEPLKKNEKPGQRPMRLPTVTDLFPILLDASIPESDDVPSCSLAEALEKQDLFINQTIATFGLQLLWTLFRNAGVDHSVFFVNLSTGLVVPMAVDKEAWKRFAPKKPTRIRKKAATDLQLVEMKEAA
jgi:PRTRC genetic system ThiF family protein